MKQKIHKVKCHNGRLGLVLGLV